MAAVSEEAPFRGVVFDLDGTLVDTLDEITAGLNAGLASVKVGPHPRESVRGWVGDGVAALVARALPGAPPELVKEVRGRVLDAYSEGVGLLSRVYPGVPQCLESLRLDGLRLAVLTNKPHELATALVEHFFPEIFEVVHGVREGAAQKPDPEPLLEVSAKLGLEVNEILVVGDSGVDIQTAANAGARVAAVTWGFRARAELVALGPDWLVDRAEEIVAAVRSSREAPATARMVLDE